jgi:hypothetical protein
VGDGEQTICDRCRQRHYFYCEGCSQVRHNDDYADDDRCTDCPEERDSGPILDYSNKVADRMGPFGPGPIRFGVELELECVNGTTPGERAELVLGRIGHDFAVCKSDGSLTDGFEIVTAPADIATHRKRWAQLLTERMKGLRSWDTSTCGMHVHVSRRPLSRLTIGKILVFVNSAENRDFIHTVAGRDSSRWAKIYPKKVSAAHRNRDGQADRYEAVNLQNDHTIEFRIFRGTLLLAGVLKNLEFVAATVEYCAQAGCADLGWRAFVDWVARTPKVYPNLTGWLRSKGYARGPNVRPGTIATVAENEI